MDNKNYTEIDVLRHLHIRKIDRYLIFTILLVGFHIVGNVIWIYLNNIPPTWDAALHTIVSIKFLEYIRENVFHFNAISFLKITSYYPPFVHWVGSILALIGNEHYKIIQLTGTLFFSLSIFFLFFYTKALVKDSRIGFLSAFFYSFFITNYQQSRAHMLDIPLTAVILGALYFLVKSDHFNSKKNSYLFFIFFSLTFLIKWYSFIYFFIPLLFFIFGAYKSKNISNKAFKHIGSGLLIFLLVVLPWYIVNLPVLLEIAKTTATPEQADPQNLLSSENIFFYFKLITMFQMSFMGFVFFIISLALLARDRLRRQVFYMVVFSLLFVYFSFTFIGNKNIRYLVPFTPFIAIVMGYGFDEVIKFGKNVFVSVTSLLIFYLVISYFILSFGIPIPPQYKYALNFPVFGWTDVFYWHSYPVEVIYRKSLISYETIVKDILDETNKRINILSLIDTEYINNGILDPYLYNKLKTRRRYANFLGYELLLDKFTDEQINDFLENKVDIVLVGKNYLGLPEAIREYDSLVRFQQYFLSGKARNFVRIKEYPLPGFQSSIDDKDSLYLYKRIN